METVFKISASLAALGIAAYTTVKTVKSLRDDFGVKFSKKSDDKIGPVAEAAG